MHLFYYGTWLMELVSFVCLAAVYASNKRVIRDMKNVSAGKDKWLRGYLYEYQRSVRENTVIHNPAVYLTRRMRGRKIGPVTIRMVKGMFWCAFVLSFLFAGAGVYIIGQAGMENIAFPVIDREFPARILLAGTAGAAGAFLLLLRVIFSIGYQEEMIETNLLDYMENQSGQAVKVVPLEMQRTIPASAKGNRRVREKEKSKAREQKEQLKREKEEKRMSRKGRAGKSLASGDEKEADRHVEQEREKNVEKVEEHILEAAATDERYKHLLNEEEEKIVKDVIKEFLS